MLHLKDELMNLHQRVNGFNRRPRSLNNQWQRLKREKTALQMTAELLTVRLNSVNEIVSLQEEKMVNKVRVPTPSFLECFLLFFFILWFWTEFTTNDAAANHSVV